MDQAFLFGCSTAKYICSIQRHDIFEIDQIFLIPFHNFENELETKEKVGPHMQNIRDLFKEGYYFSYTYDLTMSKIKIAKNLSTQIEFCWNRILYRPLWEAKVSNIWTISMIQGYIGHFNSFIEGKKLDYYLVARRSSFKAGTRFNARGLDDNGNVANFVELEQIIVYANYLCSALQIRGSVPLFWQQRGLTTQTRITRSEGLTIPSFNKHMDYLRENYQHIISVNLMKKSKPDEQIVTSNYEKMIQKQKLSYLKYDYFDLHHVCKGGKYEKVNPIVEKMTNQINNFKFYCENLKENTVLLTQKGVFRTNCLDCLDRTNVFQTKIAIETFDQIMKTFKVDLSKTFGERPLYHQDNANHKENHPFMLNFKNVWADCGDMISKHYTGTGSTHTDVTKKGKRDFFGRLSHGMKSLNRFWIMNFEDNIKQEAIDMVIGEVTETTNEFEEQLEIELQRRKQEYNTQQDISVYINTYNLNGYECPKQENTELFNFKDNFLENGTPDIVVIGFQEIDNSYMGADIIKMTKKWNDFILTQLNKFDHYQPTKQKDYVGNLTLIFNKTSINNRISRVGYDCQTVGSNMFKFSGYKGCVLVKLFIDNTSFCFTNAILESKSNARVSNINEIHQQAFQIEAVGKLKDMKLEKYDYKFLFGDMQYQLKLDSEKVETYIAQYENAKRNKQDSKAEDILKQLLQYDEFFQERSKSIYLRNYEEEKITHLPTYKYSQHSGIYDKKSTPCWRDRIFIWPKSGNKVQTKFYKRNEIRFSSHRPVCGYFICNVNKFDHEKRQLIIEEIYTQLNKDAQNVEQDMPVYDKGLLPEDVDDNLESLPSQDQDQQQN